jgi:hypothetical protein
MGYSHADPEALAFPCGTAAKLIFSDRLTLSLNGAPLPLDKDFLPGHILARFTPSPSSSLDLNSSAFANWMRMSTYSRFRRVYAVFSGKLAQGQSL